MSALLVMLPTTCYLVQRRNSFQSLATWSNSPGNNQFGGLSAHGLAGDSNFKCGSEKKEKEAATFGKQERGIQR